MDYDNWLDRQLWEYDRERERAEREADDMDDQNFEEIAE